MLSLRCTFQFKVHISEKFKVFIKVIDHMFKKERWWTGMFPRHVQFNIIMCQVYSRLPKRMSQSDLVTLAGSS
jgi:hypothetical protein